MNVTLKKIGAGVTAGALALFFGSAANATTFPVGSSNFFITSGSPVTPSITATFFNSYDVGTSFDDLFTFTIPQDGLGSGSISTSYSSDANKLTITDLLINGVSYALDSTGSGQSVSVGGIPILAGVLNTIEVKGFTLQSGGYSGTATFSAATTAVPEPAVWALMLTGFGLVGMAMRRRRRNVALA